MEDNDAVLDALRACDRKLDQLKRGEQLLNQAEQAFSELAGTVDTVLQERRVHVDRRALTRAGADRRRQARAD
jgi:hypothetical protein